MDHSVASIHVGTKDLGPVDISCAVLNGDLDFATFKCSFGLRCQGILGIDASVDDMLQKDPF